MTKLAWCAAVVLLGSAALRADTFAFSYSGGTVSANGTIAATQFIDQYGLQAYQVDSVTGVRHDGSATETIIPPGGGGIFYFGSSVLGGISFTLQIPGLPMDYVTFANGGFSENLNGVIHAGSFSISRNMPEPATLACFFAMGLAALVLARKVPANKRV